MADAEGGGEPKTKKKKKKVKRDSEAGYKLDAAHHDDDHKAEMRAEKTHHDKDRPGREGALVQKTESQSYLLGKAEGSQLDEETKIEQQAKREANKEKREKVKAKQKGEAKSEEADAGPADPWFEEKVKAEGEPLHAGRLRLSSVKEGADAAAHEAYCVLLSSTTLLCTDLRRGSVDIDAGVAAFGKALDLKGGVVEAQLEQEPPAFELKVGSETWRAQPLGYYEVEEMQLATLAWQQLVQAQINGQWPPGEGDDDADLDDDEDHEVPDWHCGHYYALDGSVAAYDQECRKDPYKKLAGNPLEA